MPRDRSLGSAAMRADTTILLALPTISHALSLPLPLPLPLSLARSLALVHSLSLPALSLVRGVQLCGGFFFFLLFFWVLGGGFLRQYFGYFSKFSCFFAATHHTQRFFFFFPSNLCYIQNLENFACLKFRQISRIYTYKEKKQFLNFPLFFCRKSLKITL
jgi:hypothetical protein